MTSQRHKIKTWSLNLPETGATSISDIAKEVGSLGENESLFSRRGRASGPHQLASSFANGIGKKVSDAIAHATERGLDVSEPRLLVIPSHRMKVLWLFSSQNRHQFVAIQCAKAISRSADRSEILDEKDFLELLSNSQTRALQLPQRKQRLIARSAKWAAFTAALIIALIAFSYWMAQIPQPPQAKPVDLQTAWIVLEIGLLIALVICGFLSRNRWDGVLIDERNRISLSRFQSVLWFGLVVGAYLTELFWNLSHAFGAPTASADLWKLLGITGFAPVASSTLLAPKASTPGVSATPAQSAGTGFVLPAPTPPPGQPDRRGQLDRNTTAETASWSDLYFGEEVSNRYSIDMSRLQQFVGTIALAIAFCDLTMSQLVHTNNARFDMPELGSGFIWLIAISTGVYLAGKAAPKPLA